MSRPLRVLIAFAVFVIGFIVIVHVMNIPAESYEPPPMLYKHATAHCTGKVTGTSQQGFSGHLLQGTDVFSYVSYSFTPPSQRVTLPNGMTEHRDYTTPYNGKVHVADLNDTSIQAGTPVYVQYDPLDPAINGVPGTVGVWSTNTGYLNPYLWWYVGILAGTLILQELMRMLTRTNDFSA